MNDLCNPYFDALLERIVTQEEVKQARAYAQAATNGEILPEEAAEWMKGQRTGFIDRKSGRILTGGSESVVSIQDAHLESHPEIKKGSVT
jgi:hypothetical protein